MNLSQLQKKLFEGYVKNGYCKFWNQNDKVKTDIAELGMINTEVAEVIENIFKEGYEVETMKECADIIIRTLNFMTRKGYDAETYILIKNNINNERGFLHGKRSRT